MQVFVSSRRFDSLRAFFCAAVIGSLLPLFAGGCAPHRPVNGLHVDASSGAEDKVDDLRSHVYHKTDLTQKDANGRTALHLAVLNNLDESAKVLLDAKVDPSPTDSNDNTPLHLAAQNGYSKLIDVLLAHGASVNAKNNEGRTPLHDAAKVGNAEIVRKLIDANADVTIVDKAQHTARDDAPESLRYLFTGRGTR